MERNKMILAIVRGTDRYDTVSELNKNGFYVTVLSTTGGFLRQKSTTLLICTDEKKIDQAMDILKRVAGRRTETVYHAAYTCSDYCMTSSAVITPPIASAQEVGGVVTVVMDVERMEKF